MIYETMRPLKSRRTDELLNDSRMGWKIMKEIHKLTDKKNVSDNRINESNKGFSILDIDLDK